MKCPLCNGELDVYDIDFRFDGNEDRYAECLECGTNFTFYYRYYHLWKYDYCDPKTQEAKTIYVYKGKNNEKRTKNFRTNI